MRFHELPSEPLIIRASVSTYVVFGLMWGALLAGLILIPRNPGYWGVVALSLLGFTLSFAWIASLKLVIANEFMSYRTLFTGTRSFALSEIECSDLAIGYESVSEHFKPPIRLVIRPHQSTGKKPINVNLKVLNKSDIARLMKILGSQVEKMKVEESQ